MIETKNDKPNNQMQCVPGVMVQHITDLDVHRPIWTNQHIARSTRHHGIHHLSSAQKILPDRKKKFLFRQPYKFPPATGNNFPAN